MIHNIFLDIQINSITDEVLSIGALGCNKGFTPKKQFYTVVRPENPSEITDEELKYHRIHRSRVFSSRPAADVVGAFFKNFLHEVPKHGHLYIVWNAETLRRFEMLANSCGYALPKYRIVELQQVMDFIDIYAEGSHNLEYHLKSTGFVYEKIMMSNSEYLTDIMSDFYMHVRRKLFENWKEERAVVFKSKGSNVFHKAECGYGNRILESNQEQISPARIIDGLVPCKFCRHDMEWKMKLFGTLNLNKEGKRAQAKVIHGIKIGQAKRELNIVGNEFELEEIRRICAHFGFCYKVAENSISVNTGKASWIIKHNNNEVDVLLHENWDLRPEKSYKAKKTLRIFDAYESGYHDQKVGLTSLVDVCEYIYKHDNNPYAYKQNKKARLSALFEMIEKAG